MIQLRSSAALYGFLSIILLLIPKICCGIDLTDSPYHLVNQSLVLQDIKTAYQIVPAWWLTDCQGALFIYLFGDGYLAQKILGAVLVALSIGLTAYHFRTYFNNPVFFFGVCALSAFYFQPHPLLPDYYTIPALWMTVYALLFLNLLKSPCILKGILSGIVLAVCIFSRLPTASLGLIPVLCLFFLEWPVKKYIFLQLGCTLLTISGILLIMHHQGVLDSWTEALTQRGSSEFSNTHLLLHRYMETGVMTVRRNIASIILFSSTLLVISAAPKNVASPFWKTIVCLSFFGLLAMLFYLSGHSIYFCLLLLVCILFYWNKKQIINLDKIDIITILLAFALPLCLILGSNSGIHRMYNLVYFPIIVTGAMLQKYICTPSENTLSASKQFMLGGLMVAAVLLSAIQYTIFRDASIYKSRYLVPDGKFSGVRTGKENQEFLSDCTDNLASIIGNNDFYAYPNSTAYYYILGRKPLKNICWDSIMGKQARDQHLSWILNFSPRFIIRNYQCNQVEGYTADPVEFDEKIARSGKYNLVFRTKHYAVYERNRK